MMSECEQKRTVGIHSTGPVSPFPHDGSSTIWAWPLLISCCHCLNRGKYPVGRIALMIVHECSPSSMFVMTPDTRSSKDMTSLYRPPGPPAKTFVLWTYG